jgi:hypothetical protein
MHSARALMGQRVPRPMRDHAPSQAVALILAGLGMAPVASSGAVEPSTNWPRFSWTVTSLTRRAFDDLGAYRDDGY